MKLHLNKLQHHQVQMCLLYRRDFLMAQLDSYPVKSKLRASMEDELNGIDEILETLL